ncbi:unnamed protein product, partial [Rotaria sordida]
GGLWGLAIYSYIRNDKGGEVWLNEFKPLQAAAIDFEDYAEKRTEYSRLIEGSPVSPAVLFYNENTKTPGLFTQFDVVVFDEAQSLSFASPDETVAKLKGYLEQGKYSKGKFTVSADSGAVFIANVQIDSKGLPTNKNNLFGELPEILQESALLDRIHGILPGWNLPRMSTDALSKGVGFKADFLGEIFHSMRNRIEFDNEKSDVIISMEEPEEVTSEK